MVTVKEAQLKYDELSEEIKALQKKQKDYVNKVGSEGIFLNPKTKKFEADEKVMGIFWDIDYNSHFVGEKGMYRTIFSGARQLTEQEVFDFKSLFNSIIIKESDENLHYKIELPYKSELFIKELTNLIERSKGSYVSDEDLLTYKNLLSRIMRIIIGCPEYFLYDAFLNDEDFKQKESNLKWKKEEEGYYDGTLNKDSFIKIKETTNSIIKKTKIVHDEEVSP